MSSKLRLEASVEHAKDWANSCAHCLQAVHAAQHIAHHVYCAPDSVGNCNSHYFAALQISYIRGEGYDSPDSFKKVQQELARREGASACSTAGRLFYLAVPPSSYAEISANVSKHCSDLQIKGEGDKKSWVRIVIEKPFGKDLETAKELDSDIAQYFTEDAVYRIDHYLGKELSQNMLVMRFSNQFMSSIWDNKNIDNIQVCAATTSR